MTSVVFMGTPDFAVPALRKLHDAFDVRCVYSRPPVASGRGKKLRHSPVHTCALDLGSVVHTPATLRDEHAVEILREQDPDVIVVAAYGLMLPRSVLDVAPCLNIHASLLPRWRGAAPIHRAILAGDTQTGITIMRMEEGLDTGPQLSASAIDITDEMNTGDVHDVLAYLGADMIVDTIRRYEHIAPIKQDDTHATYASKISKDEAMIDWNKPAIDICRLIRAMAPYPGGKTAIQEVSLKLLAATSRHCDNEEERAAPPGTILNDSLHIKCADAVIIPVLLQRTGKSVLSVDTFLRGFSVAPGYVIN